MSLETSKESTNGIQSSNDNLNQNLVEVGTNEDKNDVEVTTSNDNKETSKESTDGIKSSNDNLNQNLTEVCANEDKNDVEVTTSNDNKEAIGDEENTPKNANEIDKDNSLVNGDEEDILMDTNEDDKDNSLVNDSKDMLVDANEIDKDNSLVNDDKKDTLKDVNEIDKGNSLGNDTLKDTNEIDKPKQRILVCVGVPGSGKSTFSKKLCQIDPIWFRVNQDDLGSRRACEDVLKARLKEGKNVIVDRCNFDKDQRKTWINIAYNHKLQIDAIILDTPFEICEKRILNRQDHPTQVHGNKGVNILENFKQMYKLPNYYEGFERILYVKPQEINDCNEVDIKKVMGKFDEIPRRVFKQNERERGGHGKRPRGRGGRGGNRGSTRGRGNHGGSDGKGNTWGNKGRGNNNNNSKNVTNPHYNSNFPPLGNK